MAQGDTGQPPVLADSKIFIGSSINVAEEQAVSGDITITNAGVTTIKTDVALAGNPTTTTQSAGDNTTKIATTAFVIANAVTQPSASVDLTIPRFDGTTGTLLQPSNVVISDNDELYLNKIYEIADATTTRTLSATVDMFATIRFSSSSVVAVTLPNSLPKGFFCTIVQGGAGQVQFTAGSGATLQNRQGNTATYGRYAVVTLEVTENSGGSSAVYILAGDTTTATGAFSSPILQSVQQITVTIAAGATTGTTTITSVDTTKTYLEMQGQTAQVSTMATDTVLATAVLTNATTVTATRQTSDASNAITLGVTVVEFVSAAIQSMQSGTIAIASSGLTNTATISAVVLANSVVVHNGQTFGSTTDNANPARTRAHLVLTNTTTVTATRTTASTSATTVAYTVIEFAAGILNSATVAISTAPSAESDIGTVIATPVVQRFTKTFLGGFQTSATTGIPTATSGAFVSIAKQLSALGGVAVSANTTKVMIAEFSNTQIKGINHYRILLPANSTSTTISIPAVDTAKTVVQLMVSSPVSALNTADTALTRVSLTDSQTITITRNTAHASIAIYAHVEVVEYQ